MKGNLAARSRAFVRDESGVSTVWALYWTIIFLITSGFVIDASNAYRYRVVLQATADSAALGAIMSFREPQYYEVYMTDATPQPEEYRGREVAKKVAKSIMGEVQNKIVVGDSQIEFGSWDGSKFITPVAADDIDAAKVTALRSRANGNELNTLLLNIFGGLNSWDVGAVAIAHYYKEICPRKEGIMAGNTLDLSSNNVFTGDLCLHGELKVDMQSDNRFYENVGVTYGGEGEPCSGLGNCGEEVVENSNPLIEDRLGVAVNVMPNVPDMFEAFKYAVEHPLKAVNDPLYREYIPGAIVDIATVDPDTGLPLPESVIIDPATVIVDSSTGEVLDSTGADVFRNKTFDGSTQPAGNGGDAFEAYLADPGQWTPFTTLDGEVVENRPLKSNTIYEVFGCGGDKTLTFEDDWLTDVVIVTDCRIDLKGDAVMNGSTIITSWGDPAYDDPWMADDLTKKNDYKGSPAFSGSNGAQIGTGSCMDPSGGSKLIAAGDIDFASGVNLKYSQVLSKGDISIAAQGDGTEGTTVWAWGSVGLTSGGEWNGCDYYTGAKNTTIPFYYRLVY